ncbi:MAG: hypothetical protein V4530_06535 [Pseudomonadota bacterium]
MKETRELEVATQARDEARVALTTTTRKLRGRLAPRMIAADVAELVAARAGRIFLKSGISKRRRVTAAIGGAAAIASAIALRAAQKAAGKKKR